MRTTAGRFCSSIVLLSVRGTSASVHILNSAQGLNAMALQPAPQGSTWRLLYQQAMLETDPVKLPPLITQANHAILDRIENIPSSFGELELSRLNAALHHLRLLRREYERSMKEWEELNTRKAG